MNVMRRLKSIASGRTSISSDPVSFWFLFLFVTVCVYGFCIMRCLDFEWIYISIS